MTEIEKVKQRIYSQGDRTSQAIYALHQEYGNISATEAASIIGISRKEMYRRARTKLRFVKGHRPQLREKKEAIAS